MQGPQEERLRATEQGLSPSVLHRGSQSLRLFLDFHSETRVWQSEDTGNSLVSENAEMKYGTLRIFLSYIFIYTMCM